MILVIKGSPNVSGNTNKIVDELLKDINDDIVYIDAYKDKIKACTDCKFCSYKSGCSIKDNMINVYNMVEKADTLIIASPLHFATFSSELISLISRFQTYYSAKYVRKVTNPIIKKSVLVVTAGGHWMGMFVGVKETFNILKLLFSIKETKELLVDSCDTINPLNDSKVLEEINEIREFIKGSC